jgi:hypothetical protein
MTMLSSGHDGSRADAADGWVATRLLRGLPADRGFLVGKHCTDRSSTSKSSFSPSPSFTSAFRRADTNSKRELPRDRCLSCTKCPGIVLMLRLWSKCLDHSSAPHLKAGSSSLIVGSAPLRSENIKTANSSSNQYRVGSMIRLHSKGEGVQTGGDESLRVRRTVRTSMGDPRIVRGLVGGQTDGGGEP